LLNREEGSEQEDEFMPLQDPSLIEAVKDVGGRISQLTDVMRSCLAEFRSIDRKLTMLRTEDEGKLVQGDNSIVEGED
jgi:hypothetical protein